MYEKNHVSILFVVAFVLFAFIALYTGQYIKWERTPISDDSYKDIEPNEIIDYVDEDNLYSHIDETIAKNILSFYDYSKIEKNYGSYFKDIYFYNKPIDSEYMIYIATLNMIDDFSNDCNIKKVISKQDMDSKVKLLFGDRQYEDVSFELDGLNVVYEDGRYTIETNKCANIDLMGNQVITEYVSNKVKDNKLIITIYAYLVTFDDNRYNYYKDVNRDSELLGHDISLIDKKNFTKYNLVFNISNNNYYLEGFEKV